MSNNINLGVFANENIQKATLSLLANLGIDMVVRSKQQIPISAVIAASLGQTPKVVQEVCNKIAESYLAGIISDLTFKNEGYAPSFEEANQNADRYKQMMVFAVDFKPETRITRTDIATLTRALNRASKAAPIVLVCRYTDDSNTLFALSLCERTEYKQSGHTGEKVGKVNILRGINPQKPHTGHIRILEDMRLEKKENTFDAVYSKWFGVFDNDVLSTKFYKELQDWFFWAIKHVEFPNDIDDDTDDKKYNPQNVIRLITRLIFVWFLRQKGLVPKELFNREDLEHLVKDFEPDNFESSTYYRVILQNLFFATLNKKIDERAFISDNFVENRNQGKHKIKTFMRHASDLAVSKEEFLQLLRPVPFMNNSLFECLDNKEQNGKTYNWDGFSDSNKPQKQAFIPNYLFFAKEEFVDLSKEYDNASKSSVRVSGLLTILKRYNFTVEENTPLDQDVALDPELLGQVFENLLAAYNPETAKTVRKSTGSYYTPRPIVQYMVDESLIAYLKNAVPNIDENIIRSLLSYSDVEQGSNLNDQQSHDIVEAIFNCKILDPACGSGAFPMGMLQQMSHLLSRVDETNKYWEEIVINRALNDEAFVEMMNDEEKEAYKHEIEEVFKLSVNSPDYARKLYLIENCIYGVDLQSIAVQITRLRFFISLLCEQQPSDDASKNYNIKPLPNLEMKFVSANSLVRLENIDEARELFANKDILDLIAQLKGVRHELFVVTDLHVKERLLSKDESLRTRIMLSTGDCYVDETERKIHDLEMTVANYEKDLAIAQSQPDDIVEQTIVYDLFGNETTVTSVNRKELRIKEINSNIRYFKREAKHLKEAISNGRDKAMRLAKQLTDWNPYDQNVSSPFFDPEWMFGIKNGFDIVIGNPPYIRRTQLPQEAKALYEKSFESAQGQYDIYLLFIEFGLKVLKDKGHLCYINPLRFFNADYGVSARKFICEKAAIKRIIDVSQVEVFKSAMTYPCILLLQENNNTECSNQCHFLRPDNIERLSDVRVNDFISFNAEHIVNDTQHRFLFGSDRLFEIIKRIEDLSTTFSEYFDVARGLPNSRVNFTIAKYPALKSVQVKKYNIVGKPILIDTANPDEFDDEMIITPRTVNFLQATLKPSKIICLDRIYYLQLKQAYRDNDLKPFLAVFNSKIINFWFEFNYWSAKVSGNYFDLNGQQILSIPFPKDIKQLNTIHSYVENILSNQDDNVSCDSIDEILFDYYKITAEDIELIKEFMTYNGHSF